MTMRTKQIDADIIDKVYVNVFRRDYEHSGFAVLSFKDDIGSELLRRNMIALKRGLSERCEHDFGEELDYSWLTRFDQQTTTKYHRDNAPEDSFLLLGYEPTNIESRLLFADYHQFISDNNIPVDEYYERHNPMFKDGEDELTPYITEVEDFNKSTYKIVIINNSDLNSEKTFGVLHKAEMITKDLSQARVVNSMMLYLKPADTPLSKTRKDEMQFIATDEINT